MGLIFSVRRGIFSIGSSLNGSLLARQSQHFLYLCLATGHCWPDSHNTFYTSAWQRVTAGQTITTLSIPLLGNGSLLARQSQHFLYLCLATGHCWPDSHNTFYTSAWQRVTAGQTITTLSIPLLGNGSLLARQSQHFLYLCLATGHCWPNNHNTFYTSAWQRVTAGQTVTTLSIPLLGNGSLLARQSQHFLYLCLAMGHCWPQWPSGKASVCLESLRLGDCPPLFPVKSYQ